MELLFLLKALLTEDPEERAGLGEGIGEEGKAGGEEGKAGGEDFIAPTEMETAGESNQRSLVI